MLVAFLGTHAPLLGAALYLLLGSTQEGKSEREIIHCLKRYVAREVYGVLVPAADQAMERATSLK